jgi:putative FmdB family regulatory protein
MPLYDYKCDGCKHTDSIFLRMKDCNENTIVMPCPKCSANFRRQVSLPHTDLKEFHKPIEMFSIALNDDGEIAEFRQRCPDVEVESDPEHPNYGVPIARNRKQKLDALSAMGFTEKN